MISRCFTDDLVRPFWSKQLLAITLTNPYTQIDGVRPKIPLFFHNFGCTMLPFKRDKRSFAGCWYLLNVILDKFVDCKFIIHYYTQFTVHKLVQA